MGPFIFSANLALLWISTEYHIIFFFGNPFVDGEKNTRVHNNVPTIIFQSLYPCVNPFHSNAKEWNGGFVPKTNRRNGRNRLNSTPKTYERRNKEYHNLRCNFIFHKIYSRKQIICRLFIGCELRGDWISMELCRWLIPWYRFMQTNSW